MGSVAFIKEEEQLSWQWGRVEVGAEGLWSLYAPFCVLQRRKTLSVFMCPA